MGANVYALLVGVNDYGGRWTALSGCLNDIDGFGQLLRDRVPRPMLWVRELRDDEATRQAVVDGFTGHLARAGAGDTAIFYFSGYGSTLPESGRRTVVCADSRTPGVPDLAEAEINALIAGVTAGGAQMLVILDCGHTPRYMTPGLRSRAVEPDPRPRPIADIPEHDPPRVVLAAGRPDQPAAETVIDSLVQGVFSVSLRQGLATPGIFPYAAQHNWAYHRVTQLVGDQEPVGYAVPAATMDEPMFGGILQPRQPGLHLERYRDQWWIDVGRDQGIPPPLDGRTTVVAVAPLGRARVTEVESRHCRVAVDPGWEPDPAVRHPATVADLPLPPAGVRLDGAPAATGLIRAHIAGSPHVRDADDGEFVVHARHGWLIVTGPDGAPLAAPVPATPEGAAALRETLDHIGRWQVVKQLDNPVSTIARDRVKVTVSHRSAFLSTFASWPQDNPLDIGCHPAEDGWSAGPVEMSLGNTTDRHLYCAMLTLRDGFRIHDRLFPARLLPPGNHVDISDAVAAACAVPGNRWEGRTTVDEWWKIVVSEQPFDSAAFDLPCLGEPIPARPAAIRASRNVLDRLAVQAVTRDEQGDPDGGPEWATALIHVRLRLIR